MLKKMFNLTRSIAQLYIHTHIHTLHVTTVII